VKRDRQILDAAAALFYAKGFDGVGVDEIGARAGVSGPAIYHHFSGKDEILATLFSEGLDELLRGTAALASTSPREDLERMIQRHVEFALAKRHLVNVFQRESRALTGNAQRTVQRRMRQYAGQWEAALARCYPDASATDVRCGAQAAIGLIHSVAFWPPQTLLVDDVAAVLCRLTTHGLSALGGPTPTRRDRRAAARRDPSRPEGT
jgi:AcrR family transcriptional regulator